MMQIKTNMVKEINFLSLEVKTARFFTEPNWTEFLIVIGDLKDYRKVFFNHVNLYNNKLAFKIF